MSTLPGLTDDEYRDLLLSVGTHRSERRLSPVEVGQLVRKALTAGATRREVSGALGIGSSTVGTFLKLLELSGEVQHLADFGKTDGSRVAFSSLAKLARLPQSEQEIAASAILEHGLTGKEVEVLVQLRDRSGDSIGECVNAVLALRPQIEKRHVLIGAITQKQLQEALSELTQAERDAVLRRALRRLPSGEGELTGRLGVHRFSLVAGREPAEVAGIGYSDELEARLNAALQAEMGQG